MISPNPNQKTRGQYRQIASNFYGWIFLWGEFGYDPEIKQWHRKSTDDLWPECQASEVPGDIIESANLFFSKAKTV
jgi:hypothetical protein